MLKILCAACLGLSKAVSSHITLKMCAVAKSCKKFTKTHILQLQGRWRSSMLINLHVKSPSPVFVMISSMSVLVCSLYCARKQLLLSARLSHCNSVPLSVRPSVTRVDQAKTVQARITKFSPSAAWKTLVLGTVKLFHKFEGGHPERGR